MADELIFKLVVDDRSIDNATKKISKKTAKEEKKNGKGVGLAALGGGIIGGLLGSILGQLESIGGLIKIFTGILNAFVAPFIPILLTLLKPFLIAFLYLGGLIAKWLLKSLDIGVAQKKAAESTNEIVKAREAAGVQVTPIEREQIFSDELRRNLEAEGNVLANIVTTIKLLFNTVAVKLEDGIDFLTGTLQGIRDKFVELDFIQKLDELFGTTFFENTLSAIDGLIDALEGGTEILTAFVTGDFSNIFESLKKILFGLGASLEGSIKTIVDLIKIAFKPLFDIGEIILELVKPIISKGLEVLGSLGQFIIEKAKSFLGFGGKGSRRVGDALIQGGNIITHDPRDIIAAIKPENIPKAANGGNIGGAPNITISIQGVVDERMVDEISRRLSEQFKPFGDY